MTGRSCAGCDGVPSEHRHYTDHPCWTMEARVHLAQTLRARSGHLSSTYAYIAVLLKLEVYYPRLSVANKAEGAAVAAAKSGSPILHVSIYTYMTMSMSMSTCMCIYIYICICICRCKCKCMCMYMYARINTMHMHTYVHMYMY